MGDLIFRRTYLILGGRGCNIGGPCAIDEPTVAMNQN